MVGENFEIHFFKVGKNALQSSTMVGENFEIHLFKDTFINKWQGSDIAKILKNRLFILTVLIFQILM